MNERARSLVFGICIGLVPLLLLDLARVLSDAVSRDADGTSAWWPVACYLGAGIVAAIGVASARRDRLIPIVGLVVMLLAVLPTVPSETVAWLPLLPLTTVTDAAQGIALAIVGAYSYAAVRGETF